MTQFDYLIGLRPWQRLPALGEIVNLRVDRGGKIQYSQSAPNKINPGYDKIWANIYASISVFAQITNIC